MLGLTILQLNGVLDLVTQIPTLTRGPKLVEIHNFIFRRHIQLLLLLNKLLTLFLKVLLLLLFVQVFGEGSKLPLEFVFSYCLLFLFFRQSHQLTDVKWLILVLFIPYSNLISLMRLIFLFRCVFLRLFLLFHLSTLFVISLNTPNLSLALRLILLLRRLFPYKIIDSLQFPPRHLPRHFHLSFPHFIFNLLLTPNLIR